MSMGQPRWRKKIPPGLVKRAEQQVIEAGREAARSVGRGIRRAIRVAAEYAQHLHKDDGMPKARAIQVGARAVLRTVKRGRR